MSNLDSSQYLNFLMGLLMKKIVVPTDFKGQTDAVNTMLADDVSGLVDSLTDFAVETAGVKYAIESDNSAYSSIINQWLQDINKEYRGRIPVGIDAVAKEYYKERWKGSSFPVLKMGKLKSYKGLLLPTRMFFVDGSSITAKEKENDNVIHLLNYDYYLGNKCETKYKLDGDNVLFARPYGRWFDKYPIPYLIKRGVYHNWKIIDSIKNKQTEILDQIIPYMMLVKKGSAELIKENIKAGYSDTELGEIKDRLQTLVEEVRGTDVSDKTGKTPIRVTNFDETIEHLIPKLENIFDPKLTEDAERNILSALGFIDVIEATSTSRRESILNPKAFIAETKSGVKGFSEVMKNIMYYIKEKNSSHTKYMNVDYHIIHSPIQGFMTDEFKRQLKRLFDAGKISAQTAVELIGEVDFELEVSRRKKEAERGIEQVLYPQLLNNQEDKGLDFTSDKPEKKVDKNGKEIPEDKIKPNEKEEYNIGATYSCECIKCGYKMSSAVHCKEYKCSKCGGQMRRVSRSGPGRAVDNKDLVTAPYKNTKSLPKEIKKNLTPSLQRTFLKVFNDAYDKYGSDTKSFRVAWAVIHRISKTDKNGKLIRKAEARITVATIKEEMNKEE